MSTLAVRHRQLTLHCCRTGWRNEGRIRVGRVSSLLSDAVIRPEAPAASRRRSRPPAQLGWQRHAAIQRTSSFRVDRSLARQILAGSFRQPPTFVHHVRTAAVSLKQVFVCRRPRSASGRHWVFPMRPNAGLGRLGSRGGCQIAGAASNGQSRPAVCSTRRVILRPLNAVACQHRHTGF